MHRVTARRVLGIGSVTAVAAAAAVAVPLNARASGHHFGARSAVVISLGSGYAGLTQQGWPFALLTNAKQTKVVFAAIALRLSCTSGDTDIERDGYNNTPIKKRKFHASFGPLTQHNDDGSSIEGTGSYRGVINKARTAAHGTYQLKLVFKDAAGAVTDTCDSGTVKWQATQ